MLIIVLQPCQLSYTKVFNWGKLRSDIILDISVTQYSMHALAQVASLKGSSSLSKCVCYVVDVDRCLKTRCSLRNVYTEIDSIYIAK